MSNKKIFFCTIVYFHAVTYAVYNAGLSLGSGLVIFASVLSEAYMERPQAISRTTGAHHAYLTPGGAKLAEILTPPYDYKYGWSFFAAGAAFIMAEIAALLSMTAYLRRFPTVEDMVRVMVPGAERKLREHQHLSSDYLLRHGGHSSLPHCSSSKYSLASPNYHSTRTQYDHHNPTTGICTVNNRKCDVGGGKDLEGCDGPLLLNKTTPDICTSNNETSGYSSEKVDSLHVTSSVVIPGLIEQDFTGPLNQGPFHASSSSPQSHQQSFAGQTVPIKIKKSVNNPPIHQPTPFACYADQLNLSNRYGTLPSGGRDTSGVSSANIVHQGILGVCDMGSSSSTSSSYCSKSKTLQHPSKHNKKSVTIGTFSTMDTSFPLEKRTNTIGYSGSAV